MADRLPPGPYRMIPVTQGVEAPWYVIPFDKAGRCTGPRTREHLVDAIKNGDFTDVYVFAHGWNNAWAEASARYEHFVKGYAGVRHNRRFDRPYRPLLVGVFWPSAILVLPWERAPVFSLSPDAPADDIAVAQERREVAEVAEALPDDRVERFYDLAQLERDLTEAEARELAEMLAPLYSTAHEEQRLAPEPPDPDELISVWSGLAAADLGDGPIDPTDTPLAEEPPSVGFFGQKARDAIRATTVWLMKDRAGVVGSAGVSPLLVDILRASDDARVHMAGHSYGCKVCLSAITEASLPRAVDSLLLLQPAVNHLCFATDATGTGEPGGYRIVLDRVRLPILSTFSRRDAPLTRFFHLALRRSSDLGELSLDEVPSRYAALGGFGPRGCPDDCREIEMPGRGRAYDFGAGAPRIYALSASDAISGHGDVSNDATWWALYSQVDAPGP